MTTIESLQERYRDFVVERGWNQFHTPKNLAGAISIEASELQELFLWHDNHDAETVKDDPELHGRVEAELADIVIYCLGLATQLDIDILDAVEAKLEENESRFDEKTSTEITEDLQRWQRE